MAARRLIVVGSGEVAEHLARLADLLGYASVMCAGEDLPSDAAGDDDLVIAHADPARGRELLRDAAGLDCAYIGLVAPHREAMKALLALSNQRVPKARLDRIAAPAGVNIGAESPGEIAIAVAAELVARRHSGTTPLLDHAANQGGGGGQPS